MTTQEVVTVTEGLQETSYTVLENLPVGRYRYWVRADSAEGEQSDWGTPFVFDVKTRAVLETVQPTFSSRPTFRWNTPATGNLQPELDRFRIFLRRTDVQPHQDLISDNVFDITGNEFTVPNDLADGIYRVWIQRNQRHNVVEGFGGDHLEHRENLRNQRQTDRVPAH